MSDIEKQITHLAKHLNINNLKPNLKNNHLLSQIVRLVLQANQNPELERFDFLSPNWQKLSSYFQKVSAISENCMEKHYAHQKLVGFP